MWKINGEFEASKEVDLSVSNKSWVGKATVFIKLSFPAKKRNNTITVRRNSIYSFSGEQHQLTDKQFERVCKGIWAGTRSGLALENVKKRPMPSLIRIEVYKILIDNKTTRLLAFEAAMLGALKRALKKARQHL